MRPWAFYDVFIRIGGGGGGKTPFRRGFRIGEETLMSGDDMFLSLYLTAI